MEPLRIELDLATNMVASSPIHLDGLLAFAAVRRAGGNLSAQKQIPVQFDERYGVWASSYLIAPALWRDRVTAIRKADPWGTFLKQGKVFTGGGKKMQVGSGPHKAYQFFYSSIQAPKAVAWCIGNREEIESLLSEIRSIGPLSRTLAGEIAAFRVVPDKSAVDWWKVRHLCAEHASKIHDLDLGMYHLGVGGIMPPYWKRSEWREILAPSRELVSQAEKAAGMGNPDDLLLLLGRQQKQAV
jgi:hypothetical protein